MANTASMQINRFNKKSANGSSDSTSLYAVAFDFVYGVSHFVACIV